MLSPMHQVDDLDRRWEVSRRQAPVVSLAVCQKDHLAREVMPAAMGHGGDQGSEPLYLLKGGGVGSPRYPFVAPCSHPRLVDDRRFAFAEPADEFARRAIPLPRVAQWGHDPVHTHV